MELQCLAEVFQGSFSRQSLTCYVNFQRLCYVPLIFFPYHGSEMGVLGH